MVSEIEHAPTLKTDQQSCVRGEKKNIVCTHYLFALAALMKETVHVIILIRDDIHVLLNPLDLCCMIGFGFDGGRERIKKLFGIPLSKLGKLGLNTSYSFCDLYSLISMCCRKMVL